MNRIRDCPFCGHGEVEVIAVDEEPRTLAVRCPECGAVGPRSLSDDPANAVFAWNQRMGRLSVVRESE